MQRNDSIVPRLSAGAGDGVTKMCAMQVMSWQNGDTKITDYPTCSARPLASMVQMVNDTLAGNDGYLSPENAVIALDLGWQTVGTADVPDTLIHAWMAEMLDSPLWGAIRFAKGDGIDAIRTVAELHRKVARGEIRSAAGSAAWSAARSAAESAAGSAALIEFTREAIAAWRRLAELDVPAVDYAATDAALVKMTTPGR